MTVATVQVGATPTELPRASAAASDGNTRLLLWRRVVGHFP